MAMDPNSNSVYNPGLTSPNPLPPQGGAGMGGGSNTPSPIKQLITFGRKTNSIASASTDYFDGIYLQKNSGADSICDYPAFFRAMDGDVIKKVSVGVGVAETGVLQVGLYSATSIAGPWTLVAQTGGSVVTIDGNHIIDLAINVQLTKGLYYYLAVAAKTIQVIQWPLSGGSEKWTYAAPMTGSLDSGSNSNYAIECYATVERTVNP